MRANWIEATSSTGGTGALTLTDVANRPNFDDVFSGTTLVEYVVEEPDAGKFESGVGSFVASTKVLTRSRILSTFTAGAYDATQPAAVDFGTSGVTVRCAPTADIGAYGHTWVQGSFGDGAYVGQSYAAASSPGNNTLTIDREYYCPMWWGGGRITSVAVYVSVLQASSGVKAAIYEVGTDGLPGRRLWHTASPLAGTAVAMVAESVALHLPPGWYYYGIIASHALSLRATVGPAMNPLGSATGIPINYLYRAGAYASGLADPAPAPTGSIGNTNAPALFLGVA